MYTPQSNASKIGDPFAEICNTFPEVPVTNARVEAPVEIITALLVNELNPVPPY